MTDMIDQSVLFDDYSSDSDDPGVEVFIEHRGRNLRFRMRKSLPLGEKQDALASSMALSISKDGVPHIDHMDNAAYTEKIVLAALKEWPFVGKDGKPIPINKETVHKTDGALLDKINAIVMGQEEAQKSALIPFEMKSGVVS